MALNKFMFNFCEPAASNIREAWWDILASALNLHIVRIPVEVVAASGASRELSSPPNPVTIKRAGGTSHKINKPNRQPTPPLPNKAVASESHRSAVMSVGLWRADCHPSPYCVLLSGCGGGGGRETRKRKYWGCFPMLAP
ncbi:hypothetical protein Pcinc_027197 [Petrolisthes cinctipes]|uniref:Uncharacterized protein n=1 Tax=Petrolisthes cinctipes TaxID=88211 RepID=A0AAE1KB60_PETCI|nr:hypothetical protein Pcinc_027197 [Petrolisthes cinctipes]